MPAWLDLTLMASTVATGVWLLVRAVVRHSRCEACPANPTLLQQTQMLLQQSLPAGTRQAKPASQLGIGRSSVASAARAAASAASRGAPSS